MSDQVEITLRLTLEQAQAVSQALDLYTRMGLGQMREIGNLVRHHHIPFISGASMGEIGEDLLAKMDAIEDLCAGISRQLGFQPGASYGIGNPHVPVASKRAYEIQKVLDKALAEHRNPNPDFRGVDYDGLIVRYTADPAPVAQITAPSEDSAAVQT